MITDDRGYFEIKEYKGESLSVVPEKEGYVLWTTTNAGGIYSSFWPAEKRFKPDPNKPVVIRMWRLQGAEPLIDFMIQTLMPLNGTPVSFDLLTGKRTVTGGDVALSVESSSKPNVLQKYGWKALVQVQDGGLIPCNDIAFDKTFLLPENGYQPNNVIEYTHGQSHWSSSFDGGENEGGVRVKPSARPMAGL